MRKQFTSLTRIIAKLSLLLATTIFISNIYAQDYNYSDSWGKSGIILKGQTRAGVNINYSINKFSLKDFELKGEAMKNVTLPGSFLQNDEGAPNLPAKSRYIAIPQGATAELEITNMRTEKIKNVNIAPAPRIPLETDNGPLHYEKNKEIYEKNAFYPAKPVILSEQKQIRGVDVVILGITPFQYNPVTKELIVYRDIELQVNFKGGNGHFGEDRLRSRWYDPMLSDMLINYKSLPKIDYHERILNSRDESGYEYLIVSPNGEEYQSWADSIRLFRIKQGIISGVVTLEEIGGNDANLLEEYFDNAYNNWDIPPVAVLLIGDYGSSDENSITSPTWNGYCISDNIYADVDHDDLPDMSFARITAQNESQLESMITKFLDYERTPPENEDFYNNPVTAMGWQTSRWFQLCSEIINGFWEYSLDKEPVRENAIYSGSPGSVWSTATNTQEVVDYFGPDGQEYIPETPEHLDDWGGNAQRLNKDINSGAFMIQHRDHGSVTAWGEPAYDVSDINNLYNTDLTFVMSINCLTGKYNSSGECFAEKFHRYTHDGENSGALGIIAASEVSYSFVNDTYVWGMFDNLWPDFMPDYESTPEPRGIKPAFANSAGKYHLEQSSWPYNEQNKVHTYYLFHHHGGAFLTVYSEVPQDLNTDHMDVVLEGKDYFTVKSNEDSDITLTVGDEIIGSGVGTGSPLDISIEPQKEGTTVDLVITKQNYYRYVKHLPVIQPDEAYCLYYSHSFSDTSGNNNGCADYGESVNMTITLENLGLKPGVNISTEITTSSLYITLTDNNELYDSIPADDTASMPNGFSFDVADDVPDMSNVNIEVTASNDSSVWESSFSFKIHAPVFEVKNLAIDDSEKGNDNGLMDPGETVDIHISTLNKGHCESNNTVGSMEMNCPYILVENDTYDIGTIGLLQSKDAIFTVTIDSAAPPGSLAYIDFEVTAGSYNDDKSFTEEIGTLYEDWETGDFSKFNWQFGGDKDWKINSTSYEGDYSAISGKIGNNQKTKLYITTTVNRDDSISFYVKVSSESGRDKIEFFIDGSKQDDWSGIMDWQHAVFPVTSGDHTFKWIYSKDDYVSLGDDRSWIDYIMFPPMPVLSAFAGHDDNSCKGSNYQCDGVATNYTSIEWTTNGTGSFDDPAIEDPIYMPSQEDFDNGQVKLTMTAEDGQGSTDSDYMILTFITEPEAPDMPFGPEYVDVYVTTHSTYELNPVDYASSYEWSIEPEDAGSTSSNADTAVIEWNTEYLGTAYIKAKGINECGEGEWSESLEVTVDNTVRIPEQSENKNIIIYPNPSKGVFNIEVYPETQEKIIINIFNTTGTLIYNETRDATDGIIKSEVDLSSFSKGLYFIKITGTETNYCNKLIVN